MGVPLVRSAALAARLEPPIEELSYLESDVLVKTSSRGIHDLPSHQPLSGLDR